MERRTKVRAEDGKQEIWIDREFEIPLESLFKAFVEPRIVEQWMGTKVMDLDDGPLGRYRFKTTDPKGNIHLFTGCIHESVPYKKITRTFKMENTGFPVQLEYLEFGALGEKRSKLNMQVVYKSVEVRNQVLKLPFVQGINWAHDRLQEVLDKLEQT